MKEHIMKLNPSPFEMIRSGKKTIELRLYDEKRKCISNGEGVNFIICSFIIFPFINSNLRRQYYQNNTVYSSFIGILFFHKVLKENITTYFCTKQNGQTFFFYFLP